MKKETKPKHFIKKPKYIGGKEGWKNFLKENLKYPKAAIENKVEGLVHISYEVNEKGKIVRPKITKGIGFGCDEEALRLVKMMKYEQVTNRKVRVTFNQKIRIKFELPKQKKETTDSQSVSYNIVIKKSEKTETKKKNNYNYTIKW